MSELEVDTGFQESLCVDFDTLNFTNAEEDNDTKKPRKMKPTKAYFDFKEKQLIGNEPHMCGDARPPPRFTSSVTSTTPEELLQRINDKIEKSTARREEFIQGIVQKSRRVLEKVHKARERLVQKEQEMSKVTETALQEKKQAVEKERQRTLQFKLERIQKRLAHAKMVKDKKLNDSQSIKRLRTEVISQQ